MGVRDPAQWRRAATARLGLAANFARTPASARACVPHWPESAHSGTQTGVGAGVRADLSAYASVPPSWDRREGRARSLSPNLEAARCAGPHVKRERKPAAVAFDDVGYREEESVPLVGGEQYVILVVKLRRPAEGQALPVQSAAVGHARIIGR